MKKSGFAMLTIFACIWVTGAYTQTVEELQTNYINALGGKEKINGLKSIVMETNMQAMGMELPAKIWIVYNTATRQEIEVQGQKIITFIGKDKGWSINPLTGSTEAQPLPDEAVKSAAGSLSAGGELTNYKENGYAATYEGKDTVNGAAVHKIKLSKGDVLSTIYIDAASYHLVRNTTKATVAGQEVEQTTNYSNYKKTPEGFLFAYNMVVSSPMVGEIKATITKIDVNASLDIKELENPH
ncbi:hypothetical protein [Agriterribacter sp.]|uniref:hypothetical protein n=1 Tax=Agriterribacter sp. TaxID=2821509 RepID=UPI002C0B9FC4|nr:hypothetical protein [Agriterribacter sp.]HRP57511.1 hypothetical protein [Agriterribacter sp.]